ncbi:unnamed protein product [Absidia cylindrospora]
MEPWGYPPMQRLYWAATTLWIKPRMYGDPSLDISLHIFEVIHGVAEYVLLIYAKTKFENWTIISHHCYKPIYPRCHIYLSNYLHSGILQLYLSFSYSQFGFGVELKLITLSTRNLYCRFTVLLL